MYYFAFICAKLQLPGVWPQVYTIIHVLQGDAVCSRPSCHLRTSSRHSWSRTATRSQIAEWSSSGPNSLYLVELDTRPQHLTYLWKNGKDQCNSSLSIPNPTSHSHVYCLNHASMYNYFWAQYYPCILGFYFVSARICISGFKKHKVTMMYPLLSSNYSAWNSWRLQIMLSMLALWNEKLYS